MIMTAINVLDVTGWADLDGMHGEECFKKIYIDVAMKAGFSFFAWRR